MRFREVGHIRKAIKHIKDLHPNKIVRHYRGYILIAKNEKAFDRQRNEIHLTHTTGFLTVQKALTK